MKLVVGEVRQTNFEPHPNFIKEKNYQKGRYTVAYFWEMRKKLEIKSQEQKNLKIFSNAPGYIRHFVF